MQTQMIRTTISLPKNLYEVVKIKALQQRKTVSQYLTDILKGDSIETILPIKNPRSLLGTYHLGIKEPVYKHRSDLYEERINRKMGIR